MKKALVVASGGQDSTTCLFWAKGEFEEVEAVTFTYGQRHGKAELAAVKTVCEMAEVPLAVLNFSIMEQLSSSSLIDHSQDIAFDLQLGLPNTFVPGRNLFFLLAAAVLASSKDCRHLVLGVCEADYSGYPDCRDATIRSMERTLRLGLERPHFFVHAPLMFLTKAESIVLARHIGAMKALAYSHSCYRGSQSPCGVCPACILRAKGFAEAKTKDPLIERLTRESHDLSQSQTSNVSSP